MIITESIPKKNTLRSYFLVIDRLLGQFGECDLSHLTTEHIHEFLNQLTEGCKPRTKHIRFSCLSSFFNFVQSNLEPDFANPCNSPMIRKLFRSKVKMQWDIIEKDTVDEIIFRTTKIRDRLLLELMARGAMRIGAEKKIENRMN